MLLFPFFLWLVVAEQWYEALFEAGNKKKSKLIQCFYIASWFALPVIVYGNTWKYLFVLLVYMLLRMGVADYAAASFRDLSWNHQGTTTYIWDPVINSIKPYKALYIAFMAICIISAFYLSNSII